MIARENVDIRYAFKVLFLCLASVNLGHTFDFMWLGVLFAIYFVVIGVLNATRRREFAKRPRYNKILAYGAIVPLALFWVMTPSSCREFTCCIWRRCRNGAAEMAALRFLSPSMAWARYSLECIWCRMAGALWAL